MWNFFGGKQVRMANAISAPSSLGLSENFVRNGMLYARFKP